MRCKTYCTTILGWCKILIILANAEKEMWSNNIIL